MCWWKGAVGFHSLDGGMGPRSSLGTVLLHVSGIDHSSSTRRLDTNITNTHECTECPEMSAHWHLSVILKWAVNTEPKMSLNVVYTCTLLISVPRIVLPVQWTLVALHSIYVYLPSLNWSRIEVSTKGRTRTRVWRCVCMRARACACLPWRTSERTVNFSSTFLCVVQRHCRIGVRLFETTQLYRNFGDQSPSDVPQLTRTENSTARLWNPRNSQLQIFITKTALETILFLVPCCSGYTHISLIISVKLLKLEQRPLKRGTAGCP